MSISTPPALEIGHASSLLPLTAPPSLTGGVIRRCLEDFQVEEIGAVEPAGEGEHVWLQVRKQGLNTEQVARALAAGAGVAGRDIGFAGLKDRHAVTTQWFSVRLANRAAPEWEACVPPGCQVLRVHLHRHKLKRGALEGNRFAVVIREARGDWRELATRLAQIRDRGVPNYFGEQRFGRQGANLDRALAMFGGKDKVRSRHLRGLYLSAARAWLFNHVLAERVRSNKWANALEGDAMNLDGSRSFFAAPAIDETIVRRIYEQDIHPTGPLWGKGELPCSGAARKLELEVAQCHPEFCEGLERAGLRQERRALRMRVKDLDWQLGPDNEQLRLTFTLQAGSYATAVLRELVRYEDYTKS